MTKRSDRPHRPGASPQAKADLELNFLLAEIEGRLREPSDDLIRRTSERIREAIKEFDAKESAAATSTGSENLLSFFVNRLSDWLAALPRLEFRALQFGNMATAHADTRIKGKTGREPTPHYCTWKQDDMQLTLSCPRKAPYTVTLRVDQGPDVELTKLCWINEDALGGDPGAPVEPLDFPLERIGDRAYRVVSMDEEDFFTRMGSLSAATERENEEGIDPRLFLPFVN